MDKTKKQTTKKQTTNPQGSMNLAEMRAESQAALGLLDSETADAIIGEATTEHGILIRGVKAIMGLDWGLMKTYGLRQHRESLTTHAKTLLMISTLVHYAYALGIRKGRADADAARAVSE